MPEFKSLKDLSDEELARIVSSGKVHVDRIEKMRGFATHEAFPFQKPWYDEIQSGVRKIIALLCANQIGKTTFGGNVTTGWCLGQHSPSISGKDLPAKWSDNDLTGKRFLAAGESFEVSLRDTIVPKLKEFVTPDMLVGPPKRNNLGIPVLWRFKTGAELVLMSYQQAKDSFEGAVWDGVWFDEPPPEDIFHAVNRGCMAREGKLLITATPLKEPWMLDTLLLPSRDPNSDLFESVAEFTAEMHDNCLLPGTPVAGKFSSGLKAFYSGPAVELVTTKGNRLSVTAKHRILTPDGFVPADQLVEGSDILCDGGEIRWGFPGENADDHEGANPMIEQVFNALATEGRGAREARTLDLDGEESLLVGKIDTVGLGAGAEESCLGVEFEKQAPQGFLPATFTPLSVPTPSPAGPPPGGPGFSKEFGGISVPPHQFRGFGSGTHFSRVADTRLNEGRGDAGLFGELLAGHSGEVSSDKIETIRKFDYLGHVYDLTSSVGYFNAGNVVVRNCKECNGGALPHKQIEMFLATLPEKERAARQYGQFVALQGVEFDYVRKETHVVPDFEIPDHWPIVEIVDPSYKRGMNICWFACDPDDYWYCFQAAVVPDGSITEISHGIKAWRQQLGRMPDRKIMDQRGGSHVVNKEHEASWFDEFKRRDLPYEPSQDVGGGAGASIARLHEWLKPKWCPTKEAWVPKLRMTQTVANLEKGPLWAFGRFLYEPLRGKRSLWSQPGKDWIDDWMYLAAHQGMKYRRLARSEEGDRRGAKIARSYGTQQKRLMKPGAEMFQGMQSRNARARRGRPRY